MHIQKLSGVAGAESHLLTLLPNLQKRAFDIGFCAITPHGADVSDYLRALDAKGVRIYQIPTRGHIDPLLIWRIRRLLKRESVDLVHTHLFHADVYGTLGAKAAGVRRVVSTKHGFSLPSWKSTFYRVNGLLSPFVDRYITISDALKDHKSRLEGIPRRKMLTIHYAFDTERRIQPRVQAQVRREFGVDSDEVLAISVGRLIEVKGHTHLLKALSLAIGRGRKIRLLLVGDGPLGRKLEMQAASLGIDSSVSFTGYRRDVWRLLQGSDLFLFSSLGEGFGLAILEAMAAQKPVIAFSVMSIPEIVVDGQTGILVPAFDIQGFAHAISRLADAPKDWSKMGSAGRLRVEKEFSVERMVTGTARLYGELL